MKSPNLFKFATSELSQDAYFCWLLSWANDDINEQSEKYHTLNKVAKDVLAMFFERSGQKLPNSIHIKVHRQVANIDILCVINDEYCILIEDKVGTQEHSNQLTRYRDYVEKHPEFSSKTLIPIYLQTRDQSNYQRVYDFGYKVVHRSDLLAIFNQVDNLQACIHSDIHTDFVAQLQHIEDVTNYYKTKPYNEWQWRSCIGFYLFIQNHFPAVGWDYVPNPAGGFLGLWGFGQDYEGCRVYLQLEQQAVKKVGKIIYQDRVGFKVGSIPSTVNRSSIRNKLHKLFVHEAKIFGLNVKKPKRFGTGKHMTFAILEEGIISENEQGLVDLDRVIERIQQLDNFIQHCISSAG